MIADLGPHQAFGKIHLCFRVLSKNSHGYYDFYISVKNLFYMSSRLHFHNISYIKHFQKPAWLIISGGELFHDEGPDHILQSKEVNWFLYDRNFCHE